MKNKKNCLKVKLLHNFRVLSRRHIGVFREENGKYTVVFNKNRYLGDDVSQYTDDKNKGLSCYQILEKDVESLDEAKEMCDFYRRCFILKQLNEYRYGTSERYY